MLSNTYPLNRRELFGLGAAAAAFAIAALRTDAFAQSAQAAATAAHTAYVTIGTDGVLRLILPPAEMGQGMSTVLAAVAARELGLASARELQLEAAPLAAAYKSKFTGQQSTAASVSLVVWYEPIRAAADAMRRAVLDAASARLGVAREHLVLTRERVIANDQRSISFLDLLPTLHASSTSRAPGSLMPVNAAAPTPKPVVAVANMHSADIVCGAHAYGIDVTLPGMLHAAVRTDPSGVRAPNRAHHNLALQVDGVVEVATIPGGLAVLARSHWSARRGLEALAPTWDALPEPAPVHDALFVRLDASDGVTSISRGDLNLPGGSSKAGTVSARYAVPYLAHAAIEPLACTAEFRDESCVLWLGTQSPHFVARDVAAALSIDASRVQINNQPMGGAFGRRVIGNDVAIQAALLARHAARPVKIIWDREQDFRHDRYRPAIVAALSARVDGRGRPQTLTAKVCGSDWLADTGMTKPELKAIVNTLGLRDTPYDVPNLDVRFIEAQGPLPVGPWRSIGHGFSVFFIETFIDELALAAGRDPLDYRSGLLPAASPGHSVLEALRKRSGWSRRSDSRNVGWGMSLQFGWNTWIAIVTRVANIDDQLRVTDIWAAVDCGIAINPAGVVKQIEGGLNFGLSAVLFESITPTGAGVAESNFHDYRVMRINEAPALHVELISTGRELIGGIGECATSAVMPSVANAVSNLRRRRVRRLPVST